jgi:hypothetical protein
MMENATGIWDKANTTSQCSARSATARKSSATRPSRKTCLTATSSSRSSASPTKAPSDPVASTRWLRRTRPRALHVCADPPDQQGHRARPRRKLRGLQASGALNGGDLYNAFLATKPDGSGSSILNKETALKDVNEDLRKLFSSDLRHASNSLSYASSTTGGMFSVNYTDLINPKVT